jgi:chorismate synthase
MGANSFGKILKITSFGESHGTALGVVIDGCPAGIHFDQKLLLSELAKRRPGNNRKAVSKRNEPDVPEILSGIFENKTIGTPIAIIVRNQDAKSSDYEKIKTTPRAGHADDVWKEKFGLSDHRGGGRSSGRETVSRVMAGAVAKMILNQLSEKTKIIGFAAQMGPFQLTEKNQMNAKLIKELEKAQAAGESWGGVVQINIKNPPKNLGQPVFNKLKSDLAAACLSIGATSGFEIGDGFIAAEKMGTEFHSKKTAAYGGIRGGISTGEEIILRVAFKPTSSILDIAKKGRHDPCIVPRAIPVVESMISLVLADHLLWSRLDRA